MTYILACRVQDKVNGKATRRTRYFGGLGPTILGMTIQRWDVTRAKAKRYETMASAKKAIKDLHCISFDEWVKTGPGIYEKRNYEVLKIR